MQDWIQPYLNDAINAVLALVFAALIAGLATIRLKLVGFIAAHTIAQERDMLHKLGEEAVAFAETAYKDHDGPAKLAAAINYLSSHLLGKNITVTSDEERAAIEKAYLTYKATITQPAPADVPEKIVTVETPAPLTPEMQRLVEAAHALEAAASSPATTTQTDEVKTGG